MQPPFVPLHLERSIFFTEKFFFAFSLFLSALALGFLIKQTPPKQATFRNYLLLIQVLVIANDFLLGLLTEPLPLFPVLACYFCGSLSVLGVSALTIFALIIMAFANIGLSVIICCLYRHQTICSSYPTIFRLRERTLQIGRTAMFICFNFPSIFFMFIPIDQEEVEKAVDQYDVGWIRSRSTHYYATDRTPIIHYGIVCVLAVICLAAVSIVSLFSHMYYVLHQQSKKRSAKSESIVRKSLTILLMQLCIPIALILVPGTVIFLGLAVPDLFTFETSFTMFYVVHFHSFGHNLILLSITATYRRTIVRFVCCAVLKKQSISVVITSHVNA